MMAQYRSIRRELPEDTILFFRLGDFYEMFFDDAKVASDILDITLTKRHTTPMCGIPYHAYEQYLTRLTAAGLKVAICEQMEDAAQAKGVVRREVVRVVTPGTTLSAQLIADDRNHYLAAIEPRPASKPVGVALVDISTGQFEVLEFGSDHGGSLWTFLLLERPREVLLPEPRNEKERERVDAFRAELAERRYYLGGCVISHVDFFATFVSM